MCCFFVNDTATTEIYTYLPTLSLHDALPIFLRGIARLRNIVRLRKIACPCGSGLFQGSQQGREGLLFLEFPKPRRIRRTDINHEIINMVEKSVEALQVVINRRFIGGGFILADIAADNQAGLFFPETRSEEHTSELQ